MDKFYALTSFIIIAYCVYKTWDPEIERAIIFAAKFVMVVAAIIYLINFCEKFYANG